jgi:hypothetical protein
MQSLNLTEAALIVSILNDIKKVDVHPESMQSCAHNSGTPRVHTAETKNLKMVTSTLRSSNCNNRSTIFPVLL